MVMQMMLTTIHLFRLQALYNVSNQRLHNNKRGLEIRIIDCYHNRDLWWHQKTRYMMKNQLLLTIKIHYLHPRNHHVSFHLIRWICLCPSHNIITINQMRIDHDVSISQLGLLHHLMWRTTPKEVKTQIHYLRLNIKVTITRKLMLTKVKYLLWVVNPFQFNLIHTGISHLWISVIHIWIIKLLALRLLYKIVWIQREFLAATILRRI